MNQPPLPPEPPPVIEFKDRRLALKVFGILQILLGGLAALMVPLMIVGQIMAAHMTQDSATPRQLIQGLVFYAAIAVMFVWLGIGSFQARRWARALSLILSWSWLVTGVVTTGFMIAFLPSMLKAASPPGAPIPESMQFVLQLVVLGMLGFFFGLVPAIFTWFYQSRNARVTCEVYDPVPRWTDTCPLPVLALSLWLGFGALTLLLMPVTANGVLPVFGRLVSGPIGWISCVVLAGLFGYLAWALYRLRPVAWWLAAGTICLASVSSAITFRRVDLMAMYRLMGYPESQLERMEQFQFLTSGMTYITVAGAVGMLAYLVWIRRHFRRAPGE